ncbi:unnamed protein product [Rotaria sp. Silwood2]|nr:unnamed protein product [Rotaria sp. Silwood2]
MDSKKSGATASSGTGQHGDKKDDNFFSKTARSIRDKVQELTDEVKEKKHTLTRITESKKIKKNKNKKIQDTKMSPSSKSAPAGTQDSDSNSDLNDEDSTLKPSSQYPTHSRAADKPDISSSKPPPSSSRTDNNTAGPPTRFKISSNNSASNASASKPSDDYKNVAVAATAATASSSSKQSNNSATKHPSSSLNKDSESSIDDLNDETDDDEITSTPSSTKNNTDQVHISFDGVSTVDDLLNRIDETVEKAKLIIDGGSDRIALSIDRVPYVPKHSLPDLEQKPKEKDEEKKIKVEKQEETPKKEDNRKKKQVEDKEEEDDDDDDDEPIRIDYNEVHTIEDLLLKVDNKRGSRKVVLENESDDSNSITVKKSTDQSSTILPTSTTSNDNDDKSTPMKSILKTSQDPSSLDITTKISSFQDDQIHVNLQSVQNIGDLLDSIDDAVQHTPIIIHAKRQEKKRQAIQSDNKQTKDTEISTFKISQRNDNQQTSSSSTSKKKKDEDEEVDWI